MDPFAFADPAIRQSWIDQKNMRVFQLSDPADPRRNVDVFAENPIEFDEMWARSVLLTGDDMPVRIASIRDLIAMNVRAAGRSISTTSRNSRSWNARMTETPDVHWPDSRDGVVDIARATTPSERLVWLEEMLDLAYRSGALEKARQIDRAEQRARFAEAKSLTTEEKSLAS